MLVSTAERVRQNTADSINERLRHKTQENVKRIAQAGPQAIARRLADLDREWDILQHALQGWCPPIPFLRRLGVRTTGEIDEERNALKALRGDYRGMGERGQRAERALEAAHC